MRRYCEELMKNRTAVNLENILDEYGKLYEPLLEKELIGLNIRYDKIKVGGERDPLVVYAKKGLMDNILGTLIGNAISWTPKKSNADLEYRINKSDDVLEILVEDKHLNKKQREELIGLDEGVGHGFIKKIVKNLGGSFNTYNTHKIKDDYDSQQKYGNKKEKDSLVGSKVFGVELKFPMSVLINPTNLEKP